MLGTKPDFMARKKINQERMRARRRQYISDESDDCTSPISKPAKVYKMPDRLKYSKPMPRRPADLSDIELERRAERLPHEPTKAYGAFQTFLLLPSPERRLKTVAQKLGVSYSLIKRWSRIWVWHDRTLYWDRDQERQRRILPLEGLLKQLRMEISRRSNLEEGSETKVGS